MTTETTAAQTRPVPQHTTRRATPAVVGFGAALLLGAVVAVLCSTHGRVAGYVGGAFYVVLATASCVAMVAHEVRQISRHD